MYRHREPWCDGCRKSLALVVLNLVHMQNIQVHIAFEVLDLVMCLKIVVWSLDFRADWAGNTIRCNLRAPFRGIGGVHKHFLDFILENIMQ
jgi:hypothetical protein